MDEYPRNLVLRPLRKSVKKFQICLKSGNNLGHITRETSTVTVLIAVRDIVWFVNGAK